MYILCIYYIYIYIYINQLQVKKPTVLLLKTRNLITVRIESSIIISIDRNTTNKIARKVINV